MKRHRKRHPTMVRQLKEYLQFRRKLGFKMKTQEEILILFARHLDRSGHRGPLTTEMALRWASLPKNVSQCYREKRLSAVRCFARYLAVRDGQTEIPGRYLVPKVCFRRQPHL